MKSFVFLIKYIIISLFYNLRQRYCIFDTLEVFHESFRKKKDLSLNKYT
ncbi:MAG: hypothetical protein RIS29_1462 [Bacteroidota bacterium]|jgi:hypothetical protein